MPSWLILTFFAAVFLAPWVIALRHADRRRRDGIPPRPGDRGGAATAANVQVNVNVDTGSRPRTAGVKPVTPVRRTPPPPPLRVAREGLGRPRPEQRRVGRVESWHDGQHGVPARRGDGKLTDRAIHRRGPDDDRPTAADMTSWS